MIVCAWLRLLTLTSSVVVHAVATECQATPEYVQPLADLDMQHQREALRLVLEDCTKERDLPWSILEDGDLFRTALRALLDDAQVGYTARRILVFLGAPKDLKLIVKLPPPPPWPEDPPNRWAYEVACALAEPHSKEEWAFLQRAASNYYDDPWVDRAAIQTLKLIASRRSEQILEAARDPNPRRGEMIAQALEYTRSKPAPLKDANLQELARRVALAIAIGRWQGNSDPVFSRSGEAAIVHFVFEITADRFIYTARFHHDGGVWVLRDVSESSQAAIIRFDPNPATQQRR